MVQIWTPPHAKTLPRVGVPAHEPIYLTDGRKLKPTGYTPVEAETVGYVWDGPQSLRVIASLDHHEEHGALLHVSLSYPRRDPDWTTIRLVRDAFFPPTVDVMMLLPRAQDYVNIHPHCFHLTQTPVGWGVQ